VAYSFRYDWFTVNIPFFEKHLARFKGIPFQAFEIGTFEGRSAIWLLQNVLTHPASRLTCIDICKQPSLDGNLLESGAAGRADVKIGSSREIVPQLPGNAFDFAYIDGSHSSCDVLEDAVLTFPKMKVGGIIAFDDYLWDDPRYNQHGTPKAAVDAFVACNQHKVEVLERGYQAWIKKSSD
jgi:predicted O-methyltransferase YrrM